MPYLDRLLHLTHNESQPRTTNRNKNGAEGFWGGPLCCTSFGSLLTNLPSRPGQRNAFFNPDHSTAVRRPSPPGKFAIRPAASALDTFGSLTGNPDKSMTWIPSEIRVRTKVRWLPGYSANERPVSFLLD